MGNFQILVLHSKATPHSEVVQAQRTEYLSLGGITDCPKEALLLLDKMRFDAVIAEISNPTAETFEFIDCCSFLTNKPQVFAASQLSEESYYIRAKRLGARKVYRQPYTFSSVFQDIESILKEDNKDNFSINIREDKSLDERLANIFISSGIPPHIKGYKFLREAVKQSVRTPSMINNITKQLYPAIAERFETSPSKVERAIRHAIEVAWSRGKIDNINSIYGIKVFGKGDKPTNGELIALVSDKIIIECS